jgi:hypothetical protein
LSLVQDWKERHSVRPHHGRLVWLIVILALVILFMTRAEEIVSAFTDVFFQQDSSSVQAESQ